MEIKVEGKNKKYASLLLDCFNGKFSDTREGFKHFFEQKISELTTKKDIQKKKEIWSSI